MIEIRTWLMYGRDIIATVAVIYVVIFGLPRFLKAFKEIEKSKDEQLNKMGDSRDEERKRYLETLNRIADDHREECKQSHDVMVRLVSLAQQMVAGCQRGVPEAERVTVNDINNAGLVGSGVKPKGDRKDETK